MSDSIHVPGLELPERRRMAQALRESEARVRSLVSSAPVVLWATDAEGVFTSSEGRGLEALGLKPGELVGRSIFEVYRDVPQVLEDVRAALGGEELTSCVRIGDVSFEVRYSPVRDEAGAVAGVIGAALDATEREAAAREQRARAERAARFQAALMGLARSADGELEAALRRIVRCDADTLEVERVGVWLFDRGGEELRCRLLYTRADGSFASGASLRAADLPDYFRALREHRVVAARDAARHPATHEFAESYLLPEGIASMLDVPVWRGGEMVGVVCHEHVGEQREWGIEEQDFAASVSDMVSLALEEAERAAAEREATRMAERMKAVAAAAAGVVGAPSREALRTVLEEACRRVIPFDAFFVLAYEPGTHTFHGFGGCDAGVYSPPDVIPAAGTPGERVVRERRSLVARHAADPAGRGAELTGTGRRSESAIRTPILGGGRVLGILAVQSYTPDLYTEQDVEVIEALASLAATAMENIRLLAERRAAEEALQRAHAELEARVEERTAELAETNMALEEEISERLRAEGELLQKGSELEAVFRALPDLYFRLERDGTILDYQAGNVTRLPVPPEELLGRRMQEVLPGDAAARFQAGLDEVAATGGLVCVEYPLRLPDGERDFEARFLPFLDGQVIVVVRDVSEQVEAERAVKRSEQHFRRLIENSSDVATILDKRGVSTYQSPSVERVFGYRPEEMVGTSAFERIHPDDHAACREALGGMLAAPGTVRSVEFRYLHKDGSWRVVEVMGRTLSPDSAEEGIVINGRDVTERREAEEALRRSEERFRALIENASDLITILEPDGTIRYQSPAVEALFGYTQDELTGRNAFELVHPDDVAPTLERLAGVAASPGVSQRAEFRWMHRDGSWRTVEAVGRTLSPDSPAEGLVVNSRDVTERRQAERALRASEESYRGLFDSLTELVYIQDLEGRFLNVNEAVLQAYGYSREELIGETPGLLAEPGRVDLDDTMERFRRTLEGEPQRFEWWGRRRDGSVFPKEVVLKRSTYFGQDVVIAVARDVSERKRAEAAMQLAKEEAEQANRAKSEFLSRMSHELRTPMNSILGFAQILARRGLPADQQRAVDHILKAGRHLLNLINEVLDISRIEANRQPLSLEPVDVAVAVQEALALIRPVAAQRGCTLHEEFQGCGRHVQADRQRLTQVLLNLLSNAVKYNRPGGSVHLSCDVRGEAGGERLRVHVHDTGPGIPPERMGELFVPFARLGADQSDVEGTGLGLALSRRLAEAMGGGLEVESRPGEGSTFTVELAVVDSPLERLRRGGAPEAASAAAPVAASGATILYIEDNLANLALMETVLADQPGITLVPALQGRLGLELAWEHAPDVILLDLHLPDIPGDEVLRRLRADPRTRDVPVVVISADAMPGRVQRLVEEGAFAFVTKPIELDVFLQAVERALAAGGG